MLRRNRIAAGLTQAALAERAGLSVYGIQKLERGVTHPFRQTAARLANALGLPPDEADRFRAAVEPVRRRGSAPQRARDAHAGVRRDNLPLALTSFVGRDIELATLPQRLQSTRLLTLAGVGGSGKTRLAIELARQQIGDYGDGVQLVELAQVTDPLLVPHRVAAVVGVQQTPDQSLERTLVERLRTSELLLLLDNCEHLLGACARLVDLLLRACPRLRILATSREPLGLPGETLWQVLPLATPHPQESSAVADIEQSPAVRLLLDRASAIQPAFRLNADNADAVAQICRRLDGIPLALELAAARLDALTASELVSRLDQRFALLADGNRAALPRQQTLQATIDWSYQLLTETQQRVFERLSVFASGWTLDAAEAVCADDGVASENVLDALLQLIRKSLVVRLDIRQGRARFGLLETVRHYAWDKLADRAGEPTQTRERHAAYFSALVQHLDPAAPTVLLTYSGSTETLTAPIFDVLNDAHDNVRVALRYWLDARRPIDGLVLLRAFGALWQWQGIPVDGPRWIEAMLDLAEAPTVTPAVPPALHASALMFGAIIARLQGDYARMRTLSDASVALWRSVDDQIGLAQALTSQATYYLICGRVEEAVPILEEGLLVAHAAGEPFTLSAVLLISGNVSRACGDLERAATLIEESVVVAWTIERATYRAFSLARSLAHLGRVHSERGASDEARRRYAEALATMRESGVAGHILANCLDWLAAETARAGDSTRAARLFGAAEAQWRRAGARRPPIDARSHEDAMQALIASLEEQEFMRAWDDGLAMSLAQVFASALDESA